LRRQVRPLTSAGSPGPGPCGRSRLPKTRPGRRVSARSERSPHLPQRTAETAATPAIHDPTPSFQSPDRRLRSSLSRATSPGSAPAAAAPARSRSRAPRRGPGAQIQLLRSYADPDSQAALLTHPPESARFRSPQDVAAASFDQFAYKGAAPVRKMMGPASGPPTPTTRRRFSSWTRGWSVSPAPGAALQRAAARACRASASTLSTTRARSWSSRRAATS